MNKTGRDILNLKLIDTKPQLSSCHLNIDFHSIDMIRLLTMLCY